ncbi:MAG: gliding motility-associated C-terminal domain-containing protein [Flavipsychrobacter sp.]|nr:gliding motility-associated C-terminal domain-containing protein [Flavipsychrobacter sp.]
MKQLLRSTLFVTFSFICLALISSRASAQAISGIVNQYAKVTYITPPSIMPAKIVVNNRVFLPNDKVMLIQMKGATIINTNTASFGTVTNLNSAGEYEFGIVKSVSGDTVTLKSPVCHAYSVPDSVQLIKVAVYTNKVTVAGILTCAPWANGVGGVLVVDAADSFVMNADVDVSTRGFLGGNVFGVTFNCSASDFAVPNTGLSSADGLKGEGIAQYITGSESGRAASANGGGGAGAGNAAAGGGGNYGAGGNGGSQYDGCGSAAVNVNYFGYGGFALPYTAGRLFMGGGGGGPQHDNGYTVYHGGNGGGIILIKAKAIVGNYHVIRSDGDSVALTHDEGTSGAGAGGTIYLQCNNYTNTVQIEANGGKGGDVYNNAFPNSCHPPSGGGGGGAIWLSTPSLPASVSPSVNGGVPGLVLRPSSPCYNTPYNAQAGGGGNVLYNLPNVFFYPAQNLTDTILCYNSSISIGVDTGYQSYNWSTGATTNVISVSQTGTYTLQAVTPLGCTLYDTSKVRYDTLSLGDDTTVCFGSPFIVTPKPLGNFFTYQWQDGTTTSSYSVIQTGTYTLNTTTIHGCRLQDSIHIIVMTKPLLRDTIVCNAHIGVPLTLPAGYSSYLWSNGDTHNSIITSGSGTFTVHAVTQIGCIVDDTAHVIVDSLTLGNDTALCSNTGYIITPQPSVNFTSYTWNNGDSTTTFTAYTTGIYGVTVSTIHNCVLKDSVKLIIDTLPTVSFIVPDSVLCEGQATLFTAHYTSTGDTGLVWNFGDNTIIDNDKSILHAYTTPGTYVVTLTGKYRLCPDAAYTKSITANAFPTLNLGPDTSICPNGSTILIGDYFNAGNSAAHWVWNTGDTTSQISVTGDGRYSATITLDGCSTSDSVDVFKNCYLDVPNAFTPNGDGVNDYFFPRQLLGKGITTFTLNIFDRWGVEVFQATSINGRGWDGKFNNKPQPEGVYIYSIDVQFTNGDQEHYQGNVTLLR